MPYKKRSGWVYLWLKSAFALMFFCFWASSLLAINSPTITKIQGINVAPDTTMYANTTSVAVAGNAEAGTEIRVYRDTTQVATGTTDAAGVWQVTVSSHPQGSFSYSAVAYDGIFLSEPGVPVAVMCDTTAPSLSIDYGNSGCRSNQKYQCKVGEFYSTVSDSLSGVDFNTGTYVVEYADMPTEGDPDDYVVPSWSNVAGTVSNNGSNKINFYPSSWSPMQVAFRKFRITSSVSDKAGNSVSQIKMFYMSYNLRPPAPSVTHVWDPGHNVFTGTGEPTGNLPDAGGWVKYYPGMTVINNPIKVKGSVSKWNLVNQGWYAAYMSDETNIRRRIYSIDQATGRYEVDFSGYPHPYGPTSLDIRAGDSGDCLGRNRILVSIITQNGTPYPAASWSPSGEPAIIGSRLWPTMTGKVNKMPFNQTVQIGFGDYSYTTWRPEYSQVILPEGQTSAGTTGAYNHGDVFYDANDNGVWDSGEEYYDMPAALSDGQSFTLINFRNVEYKHNTLSYLGILSRNSIGKSSARRVVRAHNNDTYPPLINEISMAPTLASPYRRAANRPTSLTVKTQTWGGNYSGGWSWSGHYYLDYNLSTISMTNGQGTNIALPTPSWTHLGNLAFQTDLDLSGVSLPEGTYNLSVTLVDKLTNQSSDDTGWFKMDTTAPSAAEMTPADGLLSNTFTSFNAKIVDPNLADGTAGSGANIDVSQAQIWPFRLLTIPSKVTLNGRSEWTFTLADSELSPSDSRGNSLSVGDSVSIWITSGGLYEANQVTGTITSAPGDGTIKVKYPGTYSRNITYVIMYAIPFFTSNNGFDRVGAVPVSQVTADGTYVTKVITRDKAGNTGTFFSTSSPLEVPVGLITYTFDQPFLFCGLNPPDIGTYTTSPVTTRKGNPVQDGQPLSLVQMPGTVSEILPADANGIPGDGHQVLFGQNGATPGSGQASFGLRVKTDSPSTVSVFGVIGLASGTSSPLGIISIDDYILSAAQPTLEITPANPNPSTRVTSSFIGHAPRAVPDGSLATCTTNFGLLSSDESALPGFQVASANGSASVIVSADTKGTAVVNIAMAGKTANTSVTFLDKYPPPAPSGLAVTPQFSNTGASTLSWLASVDIGGAGTLDYSIEQSSNGGPFVGIATTTSLSHAVSGLTDGSYNFRIIARDADGNISNISVISPTLVVDTVAPPAVACSDIGPGNNDPDEHFSVDPNVYYYYSPTDDRSGVGDVQVQVSVTPDETGLVYQPWVGPSTPYIFPDGIGGFTYYARVRVKDKAGNIGPWGSWSNGIFVNITGAVTPPNAPTITKINGKNAVPGIPVPINVTSNISVTGLSEASNLIEVFVDDVYQGSVISNGAGAFSSTINLSAGTHNVKVRAHNGFAGSAFSNVITIVVDTTNPVMTRRVYDVHGYTRGERYLSTYRGAHPLDTIDFYLSDSGGSGFDINTAQATLTDIDDAGNFIAPAAGYYNPIRANVQVIAADRVRLVPVDTWKNSLQNGHRYRLEYQVSDKAGNTNSYSFDFVTDENLPSEATGVPAAVGNENPNVRTLYVYNLEEFPWSTWPTADALVPFKWNNASGAYMIDPTHIDPARVDWGTEPHSLLFNTVAFYGNLYATDRVQPATEKGRDSMSRTFVLAWGYSSGITDGPDTLGNTKSFRFPFRTLENGYSAFTLVDQDHAICRTNKTVKFWINSPSPAPSPPIDAEFSNAANPAMIYPVYTTYTPLFGTAGSLVHNRSIIITDNSNALNITVKVPVELFDQTVEIYQNGVGVVASANVSPGNDTAVLTLDQAVASGYIIFQIRTFANGYYSTNLPRYLSYYWYHWIKGDTTAPETYEAFPIETNYNALSGADARPFPSQFSVKAKDTADGTVKSFLEISKVSVSMQNAAGTPLAGTLNKDYLTTDSTYGYRYELSSIPTTEGTYYYKLTLVDGARPTFHTTNAQFPFKLDKTAPIPLEVNPSDGAVTNSLPSFNAKIGDPLLADGTPGSGPNMDPSRIQIFPYKNLGSASAGSTTTLTATIYGIDTIATDHVDKQLPLNTEILYSKVLAGGALAFPVTTGKLTVNSADKITATVTSGPNLVVGTTYAILYAIPNFPSNDGIDRIAAVPIQPAIKGGSYCVFLKLIDNSLNQGSYSSVSSIYEAAYGPFDLFPAKTSLYVGLYPPHTANFVSSPVLTTEGNPIKQGTEVTLLTDKGSFWPADSNGIPGDGHQVKADSLGKINFGLQATGLLTGPVKVRAVLGLASGTDQSVSFVQIPQFSVSWSASTINITPTTPNPSFTGTTSAIGNVGDLVPNGTCLNVYTDLGTIGPADTYPLVDGHQVNTTSGVGAFTISSPNAGVASVSVEVGGRWVNKVLTFVDKYPPTAPGTPSLDNVLNNNGVFNLIWATSSDPGNSGIAEYGVEYSLNGGPYTFLASSTTSGYLTSGLPQGVYNFRVRAKDGAGNVGAYSGVTVNAEVDATPPVGSIVVNSGAARTANLTVSLALSATDAKGVADMSFSNDGVTWGGWNPYATSQTWNLDVGDGPKLVYVRFRDTVGNMGIFTDGIILDTTGPLGGVSITPAPLSPTNALSINLFPSDGSGVPSMWISYDGGAFTNVAYTSPIAWTVATGFATHTVQVKYVDGLGNISGIYSASTCVDTSVPSTPVVTDDGIYSPWLDQLHASWTSSDPQSGISHFLVQVGTAAGLGDVVAETNVGNVNEITFSSLPLDISGATSYYFTVKAVNNAGGISAAGYSNGIKGGDPTPPLPVTVTDDGAYSSNNSILHATWNASSDPDSGINRYEFSAGTAAGQTNVVPWTDLALALNHTATGLSLTNGQIYYINVKIWNNGGTSTVSISDGITIDTVPPGVPVLNTEPAYTSGTVNIVSCNAVTDALSGGVQYLFERATNSIFTEGTANSGWITTPSHTFTGLTHGLTYYFRVKSRDAVLNESNYSVILSSRQDSNPPTCVNYTDNVAGNSDPDQQWTRDAVVSFAATSLNDDLSGVKNVYLQIANENTFAAPLWQGWINNTTGNYTYTAPAVDGSKIYARARFEDVAGNISVYSPTATTDGITLDLSNPVAGATTDNVANNNDNDHILSGDANLYFDFSHSDSISGVADVRVLVASDSNFTQIATDVWLGSAATSYWYKFGADNSSYWAKIMVKDRAGRVSPWGSPSDGIRVDLSAPTDPGGEMFFINKKPGAYLGETTTATSTVYLTLTVSDASVIASASVSNDGTNWTIWLTPSLDPASKTWELTTTPGQKTVYMLFEDEVHHVSPVFTQNIDYYPNFNVQIGDRDDKTYPVDTYDEYLGQNKYGTDRASSSTALEGRSLRLETP